MKTDSFTNLFCLLNSLFAPFNALMLLGDRKGIRPVKTEWWGAGEVMCVGQSADLHISISISLLELQQYMLEL